MHDNCKELEILSYLRQNSRTTLTDLSRSTGVPVSTLFNKLKYFDGHYIDRFTCVLNYENLGYSVVCRVMLQLRKGDRNELLDFLKSNLNINSIFRISGDYDFMIDGVFTSLNDAEIFLENLESEFSLKKKVYYIIKTLQEEDFMTRNSQYRFLPNMLNKKL